MDNLQALQDLLAKVEAGDSTNDGSMYRAFGDRWVNSFDAFHGSLDAAKELHEAVLPGISQYSIVTDPTCLCVKVCWWPNGLSGGEEIHGEGWHEADPARAWLIAILKALIAKAEGGAA